MRKHLYARELLSGVLVGTRYLFNAIIAPEPSCAISSYSMYVWWISSSNSAWWKRRQVGRCVSSALEQ